MSIAGTLALDPAARTGELYGSSVRVPEAVPAIGVPAAPRLRKDPRPRRPTRDPLLPTPTRHPLPSPPPAPHFGVEPPRPAYGTARVLGSGPVRVPAATVRDALTRRRADAADAEPGGAFRHE
ncbi:hypothetical protein ACFRI7_17695 [Streptomyces sp. NPDC056716]|uniref:hypothetical protein n=1 Tax=unclassified Streptomyces TaxID=2593676 RepID=UPI0036BC036F